MPAVDEKVIIAPFGIEADHPRNSDLLIQCIPGCRLRSAIDGRKGAIDRRTGEPTIPMGQAQYMSSFPQTPGMQLHINPAELTVVIFDPLRDNRPMLDRIKRFMREKSAMTIGENINGLEARTEKLDVHRMKSLCREMIWLVNAKEAKRCKGIVPELEEVDSLPGQYLLNPGLRTGTTQPVYEIQWEDWVNRLSHSGG